MKILKRDIFFVIVQLFLFALFLLEIKMLQFSTPKYIESLSIALLLLSLIFLITAFIQLNKYLSPFPTPVKDSKLLTTGAFAISRHPIYSAIILGTFAWGLYVGSGYKISFSFVFLLFFYLKSRYEEQQLEKHFPEYPQYKTKTGRFISIFSLKKNCNKP